ncbi:sugar O-acetyltransferase [Thalassobacillus sp. CUG 92003]|uniref:sugar O-acetyltransferase n=1 Tax=Thalassobacillus sp. CUG 92003 TaxID=2736641 RepID=UPI0015E67224|nr:sugar O-acetyltransferase [Thalassobacillus sp. CUG 92003]
MSGKTEKEKMLTGELYHAGDDELTTERMRARKLTRLLNLSKETEDHHRLQTLRQLFGAVGEDVFIEPPFYCDYGYNIQVGDGFFANFDCVFLDVCSIHIGNRVLLGPNVHLYTATHPLERHVRAQGLEYGKPISIGDDVWIGGQTVINPGVTIGDNVVIGSGAVVTRDLPSNVFAAGNPAHIIKAID